ncbi:hypothetical protein EW026_g6369 [Hermanssonia centrifuga]|uniref:DUF6533 domain-containing protein n=1 Tax=Hermanssonia centrifuga TaxID=98765 RepID=A0A4S4KFK8_9APHY|nr:hypothetical protein EW026_g6369 [Hermanssonia centrifuga]
MSQTPTDAQIVAEFQNIVTFANIANSMTALVAYEHIITLEQEMTVIWHRKWTLATWLFIANRYVLIAVTFLNIAPYTSSGVVYAVSLGDGLVLVVTWVKTARNLAEGARIGMRTPLSTMLLRDGTIYFAILFVMNIVQVVVKTALSFQNLNLLTPVIQTLQPILISRFLLNLRQVGSPEIDSQEAFNSQFSVPGFRVPSLSSIVGNMGEDLDHSGPAEEVEDEVENYSGSIQAEEGAAPEEIIEGHPSSMDPIPSTSQLIHIA